MVYVGSSKDLSRRVWQHRRDLRRGVHFNRYLQNSWNKYGESNFEINVLCWCAAEDRAYFEKLIGDSIGAFDRSTGFNIGDPFLRVISQETRQRMSEGMKGVNTWMTGRKLSKESIAKRTAKIRGSKRTPEQRMKYSLGKLGPLNPNYKLSQNDCDKILALKKTKIKRRIIAKMFGISVSHVFNIFNGHRRSATQLSRLNGRQK